MISIRRHVAPLLFIAAAACGGAAAEPATPAGEPTVAPPASSAPVEPAPSASAPAASAEPVASAAPSASAAPAPTGPMWKDGMSKDDQIAYMKANVVPAMKPVFQDHDAKRYAKFDCKTCHGAANKDPHVFLPKLTFKDGNITSFKTKPEISKFMHEKVVPAMAAAMGQKPFDMTTKTGFGCGGCHKVDMK